MSRLPLSSNRVKFGRVVSSLSLLLPPLALYGLWYFFEYQEIPVFQNIEISGQGDFGPEAIGAFNHAAEKMYQGSADEYPLQFPGHEERESNEFKISVAEKFTSQIGVLALLPIHKACLVNRNQLFLDGQPILEAPPEGGAAALKQKGGYEFYAPRNKSDCKNVSIKKIEGSPFRTELRYLLATTISPTEDEKRLRGEEYKMNVATTTVNATRSLITISLSDWTIIPFYFVILFAWSFIFFQYKKIFQSVIGQRIEN